MPSAEVTIVDEVGLHARPAARFVKTAAGFADTTVTVRNGERSANAASLVQVLKLEAGQGDVVVLEAEGEHADEALAALVGLLEGDESG